jgi:hypothetical protein
MKVFFIRINNYGEAGKQDNFADAGWIVNI